MAETPSRAAGQKLLREKIADIERQVGEWIGRQEDYAHYRDNLAGFRDAFLANWRRDITDYGRYPPAPPEDITPFWAEALDVCGLLAALRAATDLLDVDQPEVAGLNLIYVGQGMGTLCGNRRKQVFGLRYSASRASFGKESGLKRRRKADKLKADALMVFEKHLRANPGQTEDAYIMAGRRAKRTPRTVRKWITGK